MILGVTGESSGVNRIIIKVTSQQKEVIFHWDEK